MIERSSTGISKVFIFTFFLLDANILLTADGVVKICDFGLARFFTKEDGSIPYSDDKITPCYRPPEILLGNRNYDSKIDVWSAGCIILNLLKRDYVIRGKDDRVVLESVISICGARLNSLRLFTYSSW